MTVEFLITSLIVVASPGTGVLYTLAAGLSRGSRASVVAAFGCTLGIVPHMAAAILGLAALLHTSALLFETFKWLGVAYLLWMAWQTLRQKGALRIEVPHADNKSIPGNQASSAVIPAPGSGLRPARAQAPAGIQQESLGPRLRGDDNQNIRADLTVTIEAILINILNPKLSIFFFAFLPQFVAADEVHPLTRMLMLSAVFMALTFIVFAIYGLFAARVRDHVISRPRVLTWMRRTFAAAFVALGARLAMQER